MTIDRIPYLDRAAFDRHVRTGTPVVVTGLVRRWPAYHSWSPDYLARVCGDTPVSVSYYPDAGPYDREIEMTVAEYLRVIHAADPDRREHYLESGYLADLSPELYKDLDMPDWLRDRPGVGDQVFFGHSTGSCCHIHPHEEAVAFQLLGTKVFHLYHPDDVRHLYLEPVHRDYRRSRIDFAAVDYERFPLARRLRPVQVVLERGDALYVPVHWPHWTEADGVTFTLTRFFAARLRHYRFPSPGLRCLLGRLLQRFPRGGVG